MEEIVQRKTLTLSLVSAMCLLIGVIYGIATKDRVLIIMSLVICAINVYKIFELRKIEKEGNYTVLHGKCKSIAFSMMARKRVCSFAIDEEQVNLSLPKSIKLEREKEYLLYFKKHNLERGELGTWLWNKLLSDNFIGVEEETNNNI